MFVVRKKRIVLLATLVFLVAVFISNKETKAGDSDGGFGWAWGGSEDCDIDRNGYKDDINGCGGDNDKDTPINGLGDGSINGNETGIGWVSLNSTNCDHDNNGFIDVNYVDGSGNPTLYVTDHSGNILTSQGSKLVYHGDGNGGLIAKTIDTGIEVFSVTVDPVTKTYTVTLTGILDGAEQTYTNLTTGGIKSGIGDDYDFYTGNDNDNDGLGDIRIHITGTDAYGDPGEVNSSQQGLGVNNNWVDNLKPPKEDGPQDNPDSETVYMTFTDTTPADPNAPSYNLTAADITVGSLNSSETAFWTTYNTNGEYDPANWLEVNTGSATGIAKSDTTFTVDGGIDPTTGQPLTFNAIMLQAGDGDDYRVLGITTYSSSLPVVDDWTTQSCGGDNATDVSIDYGVNIPGVDGKVEGYAWSGGNDDGSGYGWVDFDSPAHCGVDYVVAAALIDPSICLAPDGSSGGVYRNGDDLTGWARIVGFAESSADGGAGGWTGWIHMSGEADGESSRVVIPNSYYNFVSTDSEETYGVNGAAANALDGDPNTLWHTEWVLTNPDPPHPHEIVVDLGANYDVGGFRYLPRQDGTANGHIKDYQFYVSADGLNWGTPVSQGVLVDDISPVVVDEIDKGLWSVVYVDSVETVFSGERAIDDISSTWWFTEWSTVDPDTPHPHEIQIDLGAEHDIKGFSYLPRPSYYTLLHGWQGSQNGDITGYRFYTTNDTDGGGAPINWSLASSGIFDTSDKNIDPSPEEVIFGSTITARYVRLEALGEINGRAYTNVAELGVFEERLNPLEGDREREVIFSPKTGRFVKLVADSEINGNPWTSAAEFTFLGTIYGDGTDYGVTLGDNGRFCKNGDPKSFDINGDGEDHCFAWSGGESEAELGWIDFNKAKFKSLDAGLELDPSACVGCISIHSKLIGRRLDTSTTIGGIKYEFDCDYDGVEANFSADATFNVAEGVNSQEYDSCPDFDGTTTAATRITQDGLWKIASGAIAILPSVCGDGFINGSETCDDGGSNGFCPAACNPTTCTDNDCANTNWKEVAP